MHVFASFSSLAFLYNIQGGQLLLIILAVLILFGGRKLPEIARSIGKAVNEFRRAATEITQDIPAHQEAKPTTVAQASPEQEPVNAQPEKTLL